MSLNLGTKNRPPGSQTRPLEPIPDSMAAEQSFILAMVADPEPHDIRSVFHPPKPRVGPMPRRLRIAHPRLRRRRTETNPEMRKAPRGKAWLRQIRFPERYSSAQPSQKDLKHHRFRCIIPINRSNKGFRSCGPGLASGCPWKLNAGQSVSSMPCRLPSNRER
jgi:hypothetical protein